MPRNGSGTYTLPAGNPVVTGTTISSTVQNNTMSDVASALTQSLTKDGQTVPTANLPMGGFKLTNVGDGSALSDSANFGQTINQPAAVTLASAATVNIGAALSSNITISGTTTITAFDNVADGITRNVTFSGAVPLTHNATSLILLGGVSRTATANDCSTFLSFGSGNWREIKAQKANGAPVPINGLVDISGASGGQIKFPATQNPSTDANTLDNYKEGPGFSASIVCGTGSVTMGNNGGTYTIVGNIVFFTGIVDVSAVSAPSNSLSITGLPVASGNNNRNYSAVTLRVSGGTNSIAGNIWQAHIPKNSTSITVTYYDPSTGTEGSNPAGQLKAGTSFTFSGFYMVN